MEKLIEYIIVEFEEIARQLYNKKYIYSNKKNNGNFNRFAILLINGECQNE